MLIDTHSHIYSEDFYSDIDEVIQRAYDNDIKKIVMPNLDSGSVKRLIDLSDTYPHLCFPLIGLHPTSVSEDYKEELEALEYWMDKRRFYGIGEIGIDLYWDRTFLKQQEDAFRYQLKLAKSNKLPAVIHVRNSINEVLKIVEAEQDGQLNGVFHCFTGSTEEANKITNLGFYLGIGGVVTFKNSNLGVTLQDIDLKNLVVETDSPYLSPEPKRGRRNETSYLIYVVQKLAEIYNLSVEDVAETTTANARELFKI